MKAFTLIELIIVIAITVVVALLTMGAGYDFYRSQSLIAERDNLVNLLRNARSMAIVNTNQSSYGLFIDATASQYAVFQGSSYAARNTSYDAVFPKASSVGASGPMEIVFNALDGGSSVSGTIILSNTLSSTTLSVNSEGRINW